MGQVVTDRRWLLIGTLVLAAAQCGFWILGAVVGRSVGPWITPPLLAVSLSIGAVINVLALLAFLVRRWAWGRPAFAVVQAGNVLFSLAASVAVSPAWLLLGALPALLTLTLFFLYRRASASKPAVGL